MLANFGLGPPLAVIRDVALAIRSPTFAGHSIHASVAQQVTKDKVADVTEFASCVLLNLTMGSDVTLQEHAYGLGIFEVLEAYVKNLSKGPPRRRSAGRTRIANDTGSGEPRNAKKEQEVRTSCYGVLRNLVVNNPTGLLRMRRSEVLCQQLIQDAALKYTGEHMGFRNGSGPEELLANAAVDVLILVLEDCHPHECTRIISMSSQGISMVTVISNVANMSPTTKQAEVRLARARQILKMLKT